MDDPGHTLIIIFPFCNLRCDGRPGLGMGELRQNFRYLTAPRKHHRDRKRNRAHPVVGGFPAPASYCFGTILRYGGGQPSLKANHQIARILDAKYYGVPQERKRVFIVGFNKVLYNGSKWIPPRQELGLKTVRETIGNLPEPVINQKGLDPDCFPVHPNHWCLTPRSKKFAGGLLSEGVSYGRSFRTLWWDRPFWTVAYGNREVHVHPEGHRRLSIYEAMLLQTFPSSYQLTRIVLCVERMC